VKFRFTGVRPAMDAAMFASAPPTDAGRRRPTDDPAGTRWRIARARRRLPTSARPNVSSRPVESAMQSDDQRRLADVTKRLARVSKREVITQNRELGVPNF
jgi:hypothetical protein